MADNTAMHYRERNAPATACGLLPRGAHLNGPPHWWPTTTTAYVTDFECVIEATSIPVWVSGCPYCEEIAREILEKPLAPAPRGE